jgi:formylglycine-generating enzyme required for sulfatase activity
MILAACAAPVSPQDSSSWQDCPQCPLLARIAAGSFTMGSPVSEPGREADEGPQQRVTIAADIGIGVYEVTRAQFQAFVTATGYQVPPGCFYMDARARKWVDDPRLSWRSQGFFQDDSHPVTCVNFFDAQAYAGWLSETTHQPYRLPSEAEWEYAVRAGSKGSRFWGDSPADGCRYSNAVDETARDAFPGWKFAPCQDGYLYTSPVGSFLPNPAGLFDMPGNLWEWVQDCWNESHSGAVASGRWDVRSSPWNVAEP